MYPITTPNYRGVLTNRVKESLHRVLRTHRPTGQGDVPGTKVVAIVKEGLVDPSQRYFFLATQNIQYTLGE